MFDSIQVFFLVLHSFIGGGESMKIDLSVINSFISIFLVIVLFSALMYAAVVVLF